MEALKLFSKNAPNKTFIAILFGALSGMFYAALIPTVMKALEGSNKVYAITDEIIQVFGIEVAHSKLAGLFICLCFLIFFCQSASQIMLSRLAIDIRFKLRKELYSRVLKSHVASLEHVGTSRLIQALSTDVSAIVMGAQLFPQLLTSSITLIGMLGYIAYLDINIFFYVSQVIIFGIVTYQVPVYFGTKYFSEAREKQDVLQEAFRGLVSGAKELKLSQEKQDVYVQSVLHSEEKQMMGYEKKGLSIFMLVGNYGNLLSFFAIGGLSFIFVNYSVISNSEVIAAVMVLLYVTGPISTLLNFIPSLSRTRISLKKINNLYHELDDEAIPTKQSKTLNWSRLTLTNIEYTHKSSADNVSSFKIGPIDLTLSKGDITFIAGGNGSGKSTLAKIISQHYLPSTGFMSFDDTKIDKHNISNFREEISCIYSDYYLFDRILNFENKLKEVQDKANYYVKAFGLEEKVTIKNGRFSTTKLSDGQRRRLALIVSIIEDKPLIVFDEWAADQDPQFKEIFYQEILLDLKRQGKAIIVISHDDRYFKVADKIIRMEHGKVTSLEEIQQNTNLNSDKKLLVH